MPGSYFPDCSGLPPLCSLPGGCITALLPAVAGSCCLQGGAPVALFMAALSERTVIYCVPSPAAVNLHHGDRGIQWNPDVQSDTEVEKGELAE